MSQKLRRRAENRLLDGAWEFTADFTVANPVLGTKTRLKKKRKN